MRKIKYSFILFFILFGGPSNYAQKVSNISFSQEQSNIVVSYDLEVKTPCKVSLYVSTDSGLTWQGPLNKVSGDVGNKVYSGSRSITWSVLDEYKELRGDKIKFQVRAKTETIKTVNIGTQEWTTKNLDVTKYRNGDIIPEVKDRKKWNSLTTGAWCYYNNDPKNAAIYGKLYNWHAVNDPRGLAPEGFHIPSKGDWDILVDYLGGNSVAGGKLKSTKLWRSPNIAATNSVGFTGLPGGYSFNVFFGIGISGYWWSSSESDEVGTAWYRALGNDESNVSDMGELESFGFSVRCLKD
jgi:uncharacterized protein (TIGR02145 family)